MTLRTPRNKKLRGNKIKKNIINENVCMFFSCININIYINLTCEKSQDAGDQLRIFVF